MQTPQQKKIAIEMKKKYGQWQFHAGRKGSGGIHSFQNKKDAIKERKFFINMFAEHGQPLSVGKLTRGARRPTEGTGLQKRFQTSTNDTFIDKTGKVHQLSGVQPSHINLEHMPMKMFERKH